MMSVESLPDYGEIFLKQYAVMAESGIRVSWAVRSGEIYPMQIDLSDFSGNDLDVMNLAVESMAKYVLMPAIDDDFVTDPERHNWIDAQSESLEDAYTNNRLRRNKISTVKGTMELAIRILKGKSDYRAAAVEEIHKQISGLLAEESIDKTSLEFAAKVTEASLDFLKLFSAEESFVSA